ncbi:MAG: hypothetical protein KJZ54_02610 [Phycisphaerales bacterium]|nr:hypothetical protein [Phycisphaerales bacterium]
MVALRRSGALVRLAETGDERQRRWMAALLSTCGRTPQRAEVEAALDSH